MNKSEKFRDRKFMLLLYPDNPLHMEAFTEITKSYDYVSILHDKDLNEQGELKKAHMHVIIRITGNAIWNTALAKNIGLDESNLKFVQKVNKLDNALKYLIHEEDDDKAKYSVDDLGGNLKKLVIMAINKDDKGECEKVIELIEYIENNNNYIKITDFAKYSASLGMWDVFRRSATIYIKIIDEHNNKFIN